MTTIAIGQLPKNDHKRYTLVNFSAETVQQIRQFLRIGKSGMPYLEVGEVEYLVEDEAQALQQWQRHQQRRQWGYSIFVLLCLLVGILGYAWKGSW